MNTILAALLAALLILSFAAFAEEAQSNAIDKEAFDALVASIRPDMALHCQKWADTLPFERWEKHIGVLRERIEERAGKIIGYITACLNLSTADRDRYFGAALERIGQS